MRKVLWLVGILAFLDGPEHVIQRSARLLRDVNAELDGAVTHN